MLPDDADALQDAHAVAAIVHAVLIARARDPRRTAAGLIEAIEWLVEGDLIGRIALAALLAESSAKLIAGLEPTHHAVGDVRLN